MTRIDPSVPIRLLAGPAAYRRIRREGGLGPEQVSAVFGASGAAKWLAICGLDEAIFSRWLPRGENRVDLFGTSVGAFKLAAAATDDPAAALARLAEAYIEQFYADEFSLDAVERETQRILQALLAETGAAEIIANPRWRLQVGTVFSDGWLGSENLTAQRLALLKAALLSLRGRHAHRGMLKRAIFGVSDRLEQFGGRDGFETRRFPLGAHNLKAALMASGSIPVIMRGVSDIDGAPPRIYRDGGLLDYHPVPENLMAPASGIVLYPHFYPYLVEGWFDKFYRRRRVGAARLDNVLLVAPSEGFIRSLPQSRIPDRQDFYRYRGWDAERMAHWREAVDRSRELGAKWLELCDRGTLVDHVEPLAE